MSAINDNALTQIKDSIGSLLHLGPNVLTFRTLLHLGPNFILTQRVNLSNQIQLRERASYFNCARSRHHQTNPLKILYSIRK